MMSHNVWNDYNLADTASRYQIGDVFLYNERYYKLLKKTVSAVSVERYYFWNRFADWIWEKLRGK
jgi:hypothetical protein